MIPALEIVPDAIFSNFLLTGSTGSIANVIRYSEANVAAFRCRVGAVSTNRVTGRLVRRAADTLIFRFRVDKSNESEENDCDLEESLVHFSGSVGVNEFSSGA